MSKQIKKMKTPDLKQPMTIKLLGEAIKARRTQGNIRLEDAAGLCGVAKETFMRIEHGQTVRLDSVLQICSGLGLKLYILPWQNDEETIDDWC